MKINDKALTEAIFGGSGVRRFSQDSPILPDVWIRYGDRPDKPADLLLNPYMDEAPGKVAKFLIKRLAEDRARGGGPEKDSSPGIAFNQSTVVARIYFDELIRVVLPMTRWWNEHVWKSGGKNFKRFMTDAKFRKLVAKEVHDPEGQKGKDDFDLSPELLWMVKIIGPIALAKEGQTTLKIEDCILALAKKHRPHEADDEDDDGGADKVDATQVDTVKYTEEIVGAVYRMLRAFKPIELGDLPADDADDDEEVKVKTRTKRKLDEQEEARKRSLVWSVSLNRTASATVWISTSSVKADAARLLFEVTCKRLCWAVVDSGVDARHPAFFDWDKIRQDNAAAEAGAGAGRGKKTKKAPVRVEEQPDAWQKYTRVLATYDFRLIRNILSFDKLSEEDKRNLPPRLKRYARDDAKLQELRDDLNRGNNIDWDKLIRYLEIPHDANYRVPGYEHGTHVAGIIAGDWPKEEPANDKGEDIRGVCPDIRLYDLRVLDDKGQGDEFSTIAAMQFIRYLNANKERMVMHGANMSISIRHNVRNYACGCTPVCEESERLINAGIVVVAAAGNDGYRSMIAGQDEADSYRSISITDPGNADAVITVGSTHRDRAHTYGISYFSSRGPTGDGRVKPDLVAPGEKIFSAVPDRGMKPLDGTSMAAPHVSGAAALLIARYSELMGRPRRIKEILCDTATDLGRERYFQGHGMLDILRAMQSI